MLTKNILFGMNIVTLAGFFLMMAGINLARTPRVRKPLCFALMGLGTALVFFGLYVGGGPP